MGWKGLVFAALVATGVMSCDPARFANRGSARKAATGPVLSQPDSEPGAESREPLASLSIWLRANDPRLPENLGNDAQGRRQALNWADSSENLNFFANYFPWSDENPAVVKNAIGGRRAVLFGATGSGTDEYLTGRAYSPLQTQSLVLFIVGSGPIALEDLDVTEPAREDLLGTLGAVTSTVPLAESSLIFLPLPLTRTERTTPTGFHADPSAPRIRVLTISRTDGVPRLLLESSSGVVARAVGELPKVPDLGQGFITPAVTSWDQVRLHGPMTLGQPHGLYWNLNRPRLEGPRLVAEVLAFDLLLTREEIRSVITYLSQKYSIEWPFELAGFAQTASETQLGRGLRDRDSETFESH